MSCEFSMYFHLNNWADQRYDRVRFNLIFLRVDKWSLVPILIIVW